MSVINTKTIHFMAKLNELAEDSKQHRFVPLSEYAKNPDALGIVYLDKNPVEAAPGEFTEKYPAVRDVFMENGEVVTCETYEEACDETGYNVLVCKEEYEEGTRIYVEVMFLNEEKSEMLAKCGQGPAYDCIHVEDGRWYLT